MYTSSVPRCNLGPRQVTRKSYGRSYRLGYRHSLGDDCAIDATTGLRVCGGEAAAADTATGQVAATTSSVACTVGQPRYYPATIQNPSSTGANVACTPGQPRYYPATFTPPSANNCQTGTPRYKALVVQYTPPGAGGSRTFQFQYHAGQYDQYSCPNPDTNLQKAGQVSWLAGPGGSWTVGQMAQDESQCGGVAFNFLYHSGTQDVYQSATNNQYAVATTAGFALTSSPPAQNETGCGGNSNFTFQYHSGTEDVYYSSNANQWATADPSGFNVVSFPPAANETNCTAAATVSGTPTVAYVNSGVSTVPYFTSDATSVTPSTGGITLRPGKRLPSRPAAAMWR
jgi:hypothetical protein